MVHIPARRGRPKGTGIDDSDRIFRLAELLRVRPELKTTTAIRLMGFSDPSAIRRLRDKYKVFSGTVDAGLAARLTLREVPAKVRSKDAPQAAAQTAAR
jgi:hypothetical protein